jgi:asparagine synthase (glutamine-hydrolysing)
MGAIFGILGDGTLDELHQMAERLQHRGNTTTVWAVAPRVHLGKVWAAARGETAAPQDLPLVFDGIIDNGPAITALLGGYAAAKEPLGAERLVWELYHHLGMPGLAHVSGQFALALWQSDQQRLWLARDTLGLRPLYVAQGRGRWLFATEYKALLALDDVPAEPDREAIQHLQYTKYLPANSSCLVHVRPVPPGGWLVLGSDTLEHGSFKRVEIDVRQAPPAEHARVLREHLLEAARRKTARYVQVGVALSAGLDSAITTAAVRQVSPQLPVHTFTAGFGPEDPDIAQAAVVAQHLGTTHHEIFLTAADVQSLLPLTVWRMEEPIGRDEILFYHATAIEAAKHVPLLLNGQQADALFGGMPRHMLVKAATAVPWLAWPLNDLLAYTQTGAAPKTRLGRGLVTTVFRGRRFPPPLVYGAISVPPRVEVDVAQAQPLNAMIRQSLLGGSNPYAVIDRLHEAVGIYADALFYDLDVVQYALEIPDALKIHGTTRKYILREAGRGLLPDAILQRRKTMLRLKRDQALCHILDVLADDLLAPSVLQARGLIPPSYVERLRHRSGRAVYTMERMYRLLSLLLLELWCRLFLDGRGAPPA